MTALIRYAGYDPSERHAAPAVLTPRQQECLEAIERHRAAKRRSPTIRQLAAALGAGISPVHRLVERLVAKGFLVRLEGDNGKRQNRGIVPIKGKCPTCGRAG